MITQFPHQIDTESGYRAFVTNPAPHHYHFQVIIPQGEPDFDWYENTYQHPTGTRVSNEGSFNQVQHELLHVFWQEQR